MNKKPLKREPHLMRGSLALAVQSERHEMVNLTIAEVTKGQVLSPEEQIGILGLVKEFLAQTRADRVRIARLKDLANDIDDAIKGFATVTEKLRTIAREMQTDDEETES